MLSIPNNFKFFITSFFFRYVFFFRFGRFFLLARLPLQGMGGYTWTSDDGMRKCMVTNGDWNDDRTLSVFVYEFRIKGSWGKKTMGVWLRQDTGLVGIMVREKRNEECLDHSAMSLVVRLNNQDYQNMWE